MERERDGGIQRSGSQTRIPIFKGNSNRSSDPGSNSPDRKKSGSRERSTSLSNYKGKIPRVQSNERLKIVKEIEQITDEMAGDYTSKKSSQVYVRQSIVSSVLNTRDNNI